MTVTTRVAPDRVARREARFDARYSQWQLSSIPRVRACGRFLHDVDGGKRGKSDASAVLRASGSVADGTRTAGWGGVQSCGSVWSCPVCAEKIQAERQAQVSAALAVARLRGWEVLFLTLTMRHKRAHRLSMLWEHLSTAWRATTSGSGRAWKGDKEEFGVQGYVRLVEVTHGAENGWHVHVHVLLFVDPAAAGLGHTFPESGLLSDAAVDDLAGRMWGRWKAALDVGKGIRPAKRHGVDIKRVRSDDVIAEYFAKGMYDRKGEGSTAHDVSGAHGKDAKRGNRTPFGILRSLVGSERSDDVVDLETGELTGASYDADLELWQTFEQASKGRRQLLWSHGLKAELGVDQELTDQEIVDQEHGGDVLEYVSAEEYKHLAKRRMLAAVLVAAEADDTGEALCAFLNRRVRAVASPLTGDDSGPLTPWSEVNGPPRR